MSEQIIITNGLKIKRKVTIHEGKYGIVRNINVVKKDCYDLEIYNNKLGKIGMLTNQSLEELIKEIESGKMIVINEHSSDDYTMD